MDLNDTPELAEYREKVGAWLDEHKARGAGRRRDPAHDEHRDRRRAPRVAAASSPRAGSPAVTWPAEYGGQGLGPLQQVVVNQEIGRAGVPGIFDVIGVGMLGPTLIAHGDEEQKQRHLGPMLHADEVWCQLFSEPAAGSDLAGIQTRAKRARTTAPGASRARRCGPRTRSTPPTACCSRAPTPTCPSTRA